MICLWYTSLQAGIERRDKSLIAQLRGTTAGIAPLPSAVTLDTFNANYRVAQREAGEAAAAEAAADQTTDEMETVETETETETEAVSTEQTAPTELADTSAAPANGVPVGVPVEPGGSGFAVIRSAVAVAAGALAAAISGGR